MRIGEQHPAGRQPVKIRRTGLRMSTQAANPVVEIIHGDKQDVWLDLRTGRNVLVCKTTRSDGEVDEHNDSNDRNCRLSIDLWSFRYHSSVFLLKN